MTRIHSARRTRRARRTRVTRAVTRAAAATTTTLVAVALATPPALADAPPPPAALLDAPDPASLRAHHEILSAVPHMAGTPGDARVIEHLVATFTELGLEVERHDIRPYLPFPVRAHVALLAPDAAAPIALDVVERPVTDDPHEFDPAHPIGFNGFSASGTAEGRIVYANRGTREDFATLRELGVDCTGAIVLCRYGGNYRGYKAAYAAEAGAVGCLIYTDPADSGYARGPMWPEGGFANGQSIQRGSIWTAPYHGDPLTPFTPATPDAERLDPADAYLPTIPCQPIGWSAAERIMQRMTGDPLPARLLGGWQGGLPLAYRLTGGPDLRVRLTVEQTHRLADTANVVGVLRGARAPEQLVVLGCHHDAWGHGASDPNAGMMVVLEAARAFAALRDAGIVPDRSIAFAGWAAEEAGIMGSVEWVEQHAARLSLDAVAYVNLDMAAMGPNARASCDPVLARAIAEAARHVTLVGDDARTVHDAWTADGTREPSFGILGGGSDHVGFLGHLGIPCVSLGAGGSRGTAYHSRYDTLRWYRATVGDDYEPARHVTRLACSLAWRLATTPLPDYDLPHSVRAIAGHLDALHARADALDLGDDARAATESLVTTLAALTPRLDAAVSALTRAAALDPALAADVEPEMLRLGRAWADRAGLPERPWHRNLAYASDPWSGYAAWALPGMRLRLEQGDLAGLAAESERVRRRLEQLVRGAEALSGFIAPVPDADGG